MKFAVRAEPGIFSGWAAMVLVVLCGAWASTPWLRPLVVLLLIAPVLEETVFRAGLHDSLLRLGVVPVLANLVTVLTFTTTHMLLLGVSASSVLVFGPALLIGMAFNRWRRVRICIVLHAAMNVIWIAAQRWS